MAFLHINKQPEQQLIMRTTYMGGGEQGIYKEVRMKLTLEFSLAHRLQNILDQCFSSSERVILN